MEFIVDWNAICLVCLQEGKMRSLDQKDSIGILLSEKIKKCSNISICGRNFPEQICLVCEIDLEAAYRFKTNAESSNAILKSLIESHTKSITPKSVVEQIINNVEANMRSNSNEIKLQIMRNEVEQANLIQPSSEYEITSSKLLKEGFQLENFSPTDGNQYNQLILPRNLLARKANHENNSDIVEFNYKRQKRQQKDKFKDQKAIGGFVKAAKHSSKALKICEICGNSYRYQNALESHMRRHRNEKPFSCEFCQRRFVATVELRRHMRVHTGQKPYTCHFCPRAFSDFGSRGKHERTHTGERPYACETCGKTFGYAHVLQIHILTHTGEKKYKCSTCGKGFTKKSYLISHTSNNHRSGN